MRRDKRQIFREQCYANVICRKRWKLFYFIKYSCVYIFECVYCIFSLKALAMHCIEQYNINLNFSAFDFEFYILKINYESYNKCIHLMIA